MDHRWGRWVADLGLVNSGCTLVSRFPAFPRQLLTNEPSGTPGWNTFWIMPADTQPFAPYVRFTAPGGFGNFPYGWFVFPDAPL